MSNEEIAKRTVQKVELFILAYLPKPECQSKHQQWRWNVEEVKKKISQQLYKGGLSITIEV